MAWGGQMSNRSTGGPVDSKRRADILRASPPMFESKVLDFFSRVHPAVPAVIFLPTIAGVIYWSLRKTTIPVTIGLFAAGYLVWTLFEYWLHRLVFHFEPDRGLGARLHWIIHGVHHDHPNDPMRLVMPPAVSVPIAAGVLALAWLIVGGRHAPGVVAGFYAGYLVYDMLHYWLHHFVPSSRLGRMLRERHMRHHFQDDTRGFGISAPYWDDVFRTAPQGKRSS